MRAGAIEQRRNHGQESNGLTLAVTAVGNVAPVTLSVVQPPNALRCLEYFRVQRDCASAAEAGWVIDGRYNEIAIEQAAGEVPLPRAGTAAASVGR